MFSQIYSNDYNEIQRRRLEKLKDRIRQLELVTKEDFQAEFYSSLNSVLSLGNDVSPVSGIVPNTPALAGSVQNNLENLNTDAVAIATQILNLEQQAGQLFNLFAATQNGVRQHIRESIFAPSKNRYLESFISGDRILEHNGTIDFGSGSFSLPVVSSVEIKPSSIRIGDTSVRSEDQEFEPMPSDDELMLVTDGKPETNFTWKGPRLELIFNFDRVVILNRLQIELDQHQGLVIEELTSTPDGILKEDLFRGLGEEKRTVDMFSGKLSSDYCLDFTPRHMKQLKLVLSDKLGEEKISIRNIEFHSRRFSTTATVMTKKIEGLEGSLRVSASGQFEHPLTSITHQISTDGVNFQAIDTSQELYIAKGPFWYRAYLERLETGFDELSKPVVGGSDPDDSTNFTLHDSSSMDLGNGILERRLHLTVKALIDESQTRVVVLRETPFSGSLEVWRSGSPMSSELYSVSDDLKSIAFPGDSELDNVVIKYQASAFESAGLRERREYYSPYIEEILFEKRA